MASLNVRPAAATGWIKKGLHQVKRLCRCQSSGVRLVHVPRSSSPFADESLKCGAAVQTHKPKERQQRAARRREAVRVPAIPVQRTFLLFVTTCGTEL
jgi:hypothetical protein